jgi:hypothetical protein
MAWVAGAFSSQDVVVMGAGRALVLWLLGVGRPEPPSTLKDVWNSSVVSPIMAYRGDGGSLQVEPMKAASKSSILGERLRPPKQSVMNSTLPKWIVSQRENPPHNRRSPSVEMASADETTIRMSRGKAHCKSPFLACHQSVFFRPTRYRVVKIMCFSAKVVLWTVKHIVIYHELGPSSEVIALRPVVYYRRWTSVIRGKRRDQKVCLVKGEMDLVSPAWRVEGLL